MVEDIGDVNGGGGEEGEGEEDEGRKIERLGLLVPNVELNTGCNPLFMPGAPPNTLAQTLADRLAGLLHTSRLVRLRELEIWHRPTVPAIKGTGRRDTMGLTTDVEMHEAGEDDSAESDSDDAPQKPKIKAFWTLYIDILFISLDGNPFDAAWAAVLAALQNTRLPRAWWDADAGMVLCSPLKDEIIPLRLRSLPIASTFGVFEEKKVRGDTPRCWVLADPDDFEESLCEEMLTVVVDRNEDGKVVILRIEKSGGGALGMEGMRRCVEIAEGRRMEWGKVLREGVERQK
jgi:exosome complex component RRP43